MQSVRLSTLHPRGWLLVALLADLVQAGCYKPNIKDGGFRCNLDAGVGKACPEGFKCDTSTMLCSRMPKDGGSDGDIRVDKTGSEVGDVPEDKTICFDALPDCMPNPGTCDPFCRTGCGCLDKCSVNTGGALTCNPLAAGQRRTLLQPCEVRSPGAQTQTDQCEPGLLCIEDSCTSGPGMGRCYQFCRDEKDCTDAPCSRDVAGGLKVCDVPFDDCVPLAGSRNTGCDGTALGCYVSSTNVSKTICDCEFPPNLFEGDVCTLSRQCNPGLVCVADQLGTKKCTRVCRLGNAGDCTVGTCVVLMENGQSNTTYGFCR